jgi:hypothetical protein
MISILVKMISILKRLFSTVKLDYNKLGDNKLGDNKLGCNKLGYNKLGYNKLSFNDLLFIANKHKILVGSSQFRLG